jgi:nucleoside-diphosphate-sugar epimerase
MSNYLVTGGAGFFGALLKRELLDQGHYVTSYDLHNDEDKHPRLTSVVGDLRDKARLSAVFAAAKFEGVFHCAAMLAHGALDDKLLWTSNVDGTRILCECLKENGIRQLVFTSSNCLWGHNLGRPVREDDAPKPVELYGQSKWEGEKILQEFAGSINSVIIRCPTIIDSGRLGLLTILFEFIDENRRVWAVGGGHNRYQFIYAHDLADAAIRAITHPETTVFNIGSDNVKTIREVYAYVIEKAGSKARIATLPRRATLFLMQLAYSMKMSPLGPYQYNMIAEDFVFDTTKIKRELGWRPTVTNEEMLLRAYQYYSLNRRAIEERKNVSAHKQAAKMGVIRLLKWVS